MKCGGFKLQMGEDVSILAGRRGKHYGTVGGCIRPAESYKLHYIEPDDTLVSIAVRYGTSVQHLKLLNHLWVTDISNLRTLKVPDESPSMGHPLDAFELTPTKQKSASAKDECDELPSASAYIRGLFERVQRAKESARSVLENSRGLHCRIDHVVLSGNRWADRGALQEAGYTFNRSGTAQEPGIASHSVESMAAGPVIQENANSRCLAVWTSESKAQGGLPQPNPLLRLMQPGSSIRFCNSSLTSLPRHPSPSV
ncbi:hypothetical protein T265_08354 [Opisthorchis viverrini]|uniref:LysM domain-containing protein n=1 Tax=Opisthorchis viverrini TaxID=6198 RepID=A0A074Z9Q4_OPIVI|nr:hypothetical protein T265_08354 [Opisthorchis viverrini]KER23848.1 hypothetical protein T265_08354 [Opisthorchis viverrini]